MLRRPGSIWGFGALLKGLTLSRGIEHQYRDTSNAFS